MTLLFFEPPPQYDYEPANYAVMYAPADEMADLCGWRTVACTRPAKRIIIVWNGLTGPALKAVLRHEKAHLNGWDHCSCRPQIPHAG